MLYLVNDLCMTMTINANYSITIGVDYNQFDNEFMPLLSIIDVMMFNSPQEINEMLDQFELK